MKAWNWTQHGIFLWLCALALSGSAAPKYIDYTPLAQQLELNVGEVNVRRLKAPLITWGGDIATIFANGNQSRSAEDSVFARKDLNIEIYREDQFINQVRQYIAGETPFLRGTVGMISAAAELLNRDERTKPIVVYQLTWSAGGDALVVKPGIRNAGDLKDKRIAIQAWGPHVDYANRILTDAGLSFNDVDIKWVADLTGTDDSPMAAFYEDDIDAAFVIIPDALALTSGGTRGSGAEDSVKGARILLSTKTADKVIADVYAVRQDFFNSQRNTVDAFVSGLLEAQEAVRTLFRSKDSDSYQETLRAAAELLLDSEGATADVEGLYADANHVGLQGNVQFFTSNTFPRRLEILAEEVSQGLQQANIVSQPVDLEQASFDYGLLGSGISQLAAAAGPRFDESKVAQMINRRQQQNIKEGELFSFNVYFQPNQKVFSTDLYSEAFNRVSELAGIYGGAIITIEGNSDPMAYLRARKEGEPPMVLGRIKQSARNLSLARAQEVRDSIIAMAASKNVSLDPSQFAVIGNGIANPATGMCGSEPCAPKSEQEWRSNMRVEFRIIQVEAEADVFQPL